MHPLHNKATFAQPQNQFHFRDHTCFSKNANFHVFVNLNQHIIAITNKKGNHMRITTTFNMNKSSHSQMFFKIAVLKNFVIFTGKYLCWSLFLTKFKVSSLKACNVIKKRLQHRCFPVNIVKLLRTAFFIEYLRWLLLHEY